MKYKAHISMYFDVDTLKTLDYKFDSDEEFFDFMVDYFANKINLVANTEELFSFIKTEIVKKDDASE